MPRGDNGAERSPVVAAQRIVAILTALAEGPDLWSVTKLAQSLELPASSVHRTLEHLVALEFVERAPRRQYRIGSEYFRVAARVESRFSLVGTARPIMQSIVDECGETCLLGVLAPSRRRLLIAHKIDTGQALRFRFPILDNVPLVWGAVAKAVLAHLSYTDIRAALREAMPSTVDSATVPDPSALETELEQIRQSGFAVTKGERVAGDAVDVAAPFFEANGQVRGSISVILPDLRADQTTQSALAHLLRTKASLLSRQLGHTGYP